MTFLFLSTANTDISDSKCASGDVQWAACSPEEDEYDDGYGSTRSLRLGAVQA